MGIYFIIGLLVLYLEVDICLHKESRQPEMPLSSCQFLVPYVEKNFGTHLPKCPLEMIAWKEYLPTLNLYRLVRSYKLNFKKNLIFWFKFEKLTLGYGKIRNFLNLGSVPHLG